METKLVQDACLLLQGEISPESGIRLELRQEDILPMVRVLNQYELTPVRKQRHLSIYIAIKLALQSHAASDGCTGVITSYSIHYTKLYEEMSVVGKELQELDLPEEALVTAVIRGEQIVTPRGNTTIHAGDTLYVLGPKAHREKIKKIFI